MRINVNTLKLLLGVFLFSSATMAANIKEPIKVKTKEVKATKVKIEPLKIKSVSNESLMHLNEDYIAIVLEKSPQKEVEFLAEIISEYDIKNAPDFDARDNEYTAVFKSNKGYARVTYDHSGRILAVKKQLENIALTTTVAQNILEEYPDWIVVQNEYKVSYIQGYDVLRTYHVTLQKGSEKKRIKVKV